MHSKKTKFTLAHRLKSSDTSNDLAVSSICSKVGMSRQNYYKERKSRCKHEIDANLILELVKTERQVQSRLGGRKVLHLIKNDLYDSDISIGRDRFFNICIFQ